MENIKKQINRIKEKINIKFAAFLLIVPLLAFLSDNFFNVYNVIQNQDSVIATTSNLQTIKYKSKDNVLSEKSQIDIIFGDGYQSSTFYYGAKFNIAFTNRATYDRQITKVTVNATNIKPDNSPNINSIEYISNNSAYITLTNDGWGNAKKVEIRLREITNKKVKIKNNNPIVFNNIEPGESLNKMIFSFEDLEIENIFEPIETHFYYDIICNDIIQNGQIVIAAKISHNSMIDNKGGEGGDGDADKCAIFIDATKEGDSTDEYSVQQILPASKVTILPIYILPSQSCRLSLELTFTMSDGEILTLPIIQDKYFVIPYNENIYKYTTSMLKKDISKDEQMILYFPFAVSHQYIESSFIESLENN